MSQQFPQNPYNTPNQLPPGNQSGGNSGGGNADITAPGIALIVVGTLGILFGIFGVVTALAFEPTVDPNLPKEFQDFQRGASGPLAAAIQGLGMLASVVVLVGGISMVRRTGYALAMAGSIIAMINCANLCCILGLPIGIWAVVMLSQQSVKQRMS